MCAAHSTIASFAISAGWITNGPSPSQLVLPLTSRPRPGTRTRASSTIASSSAGQANRRTTPSGSREAIHAHGTPIATHISWRVTTA